jgi:hypothetical protein
MKRTSSNSPLGVTLLTVARELEAHRRKRAKVSARWETRIKGMVRACEQQLADIDKLIAAGEAAVVAAATGRVSPAPSVAEEQPALA